MEEGKLWSVLKKNRGKKANLPSASILKGLEELDQRPRLYRFAFPYMFVFSSCFPAGPINRRGLLISGCQKGGDISVENIPFCSWCWEKEISGRGKGAEWIVKSHRT